MNTTHRNTGDRSSSNVSSMACSTGDKTLARGVLVAMFDLARANLPASVARIGGRLGLSEEQTRRGLAQLERDGLADALRVRLTLGGLAIAARCAEARDERVSIAA